MKIFDSMRRLTPGRAASAGTDRPAGQETGGGRVTLKDGTTIDLSKREDRKRARRIVIDLQRQTDALVKRDLAGWRQAHQLAISSESPNRQALYDIYRDVDLDPHLRGCIGQLQGFILSKAFRLTRPDGEPDADALGYLETAWFKKFVRYVLQQRYWGHSLIELGDVVTREDGRMSLSGVSLIPRKHVVPEFGRVTTYPGGDWTQGIPYRERPWSDWLVEVGDPDDIVLYLSAAIQTIPKKYALAFWDSFAEMFGLPIRIAKTASRDERDKEALGRMMETMGSKAWAVLPDLIYEIADLVRDTVNDQLLPKLVNLGFPLKGLRFDWDDPVDYSPEQQRAFEEMVLSNYEVDGSYFADKYGLPVGERRDNAQAPPAGVTLSGREERPFFG